MSKLTLKNKNGQTLATKETTSTLFSAISTGISAVINNIPHTLVVAQGTSGTSEEEETETDVGYVEDEELEELTESTVQIPANFAGLESVMTPTKLMWQLFEITEINEQDGYVDITAMHIFYRQLKNYTFWNPSENTMYSGASACRNVLTNAMFDQGFKVASDSTEMIQGNELDYERRNVVEAFLDPEEGICNRYGLSMIRNNDVFYCLKNVGYDRGFVIQNKKNMLGVERTESTENLITRVAPVGRDEDGNYVWLSYNGHKYVDSPHVNDYATPFAEILYTELEIGKNGVTEDNINSKLLEEAQKRFTEDEVDIPEVTMTIEFISLGDTEEYKQYKDLDKVYLFDILHIKDTERGYSYSAQVVSVNHNILTGQLESVTIGKLYRWDGVRKIGSWQVPEFDGGKIRHGSIRSGSFEEGAVTSDAIADDSITEDMLSSSADGHFQRIFAEELYISNTSEDGLLNTRFQVSEGLIATEITERRAEGTTLRTAITQNSEAITLEAQRASAAEGQLSASLSVTADAITAEVTRATTAEGTLSGRITVEAGKITQIVQAVGDDGEVTAASIVLAINESTGTSEAKIDADHVYIGNEKSTTVIAGKLTASDITADFLNAKIATIPTLRGIAASFSGNVSTTSGVIAYQVYADGNNISNPAVATRITGPSSNVYTMQYQTADGTWHDAGTFSRATSLSGAWSGNRYTVTASPQGNTISDTIAMLPQGNGSTSFSVSACHTSAAAANAVATQNIYLTEDTSAKKVYARAGSSSGTAYGGISTQNTYNAGFDANHSACIGGENGGASNPDKQTDVTISPNGSVDLWPYLKKADGTWTWGDKCTVSAPMPSEATWEQYWPTNNVVYATCKVAGRSYSTYLRK